MFLRPHQDTGVLPSAVQLAGISFLRETRRKGERLGCVRVRRLLLEACGIARGGGGAPAGSEESPSLLCYTSLLFFTRSTNHFAAGYPYVPYEERVGGELV